MKIPTIRGDMFFEDIAKLIKNGKTYIKWHSDIDPIIGIVSRILQDY